MVFERAREARDFQHDKERARLKFGDECSSMFQKVEKEKEKISEKLIKAIAEGDGTETNAMGSAYNKTTEDIAKADISDNSIKLVKQNLIENNLGAFEVKNKNPNQSKDRTVNVEDDENRDDEAKASSISSANSECAAVFGHPLFVPYIVPSPCVQCSELG